MSGKLISQLLVRHPPLQSFVELAGFGGIHGSGNAAQNIRRRNWSFKVRAGFQRLYPLRGRAGCGARTRLPTALAHWIPTLPSVPETPPCK